MTQEPLLLGGRYQLTSIIGRGGMAEVWHATDTRLDRKVAVKRLRVDLATDPTFQARFRKEAQAAAGLNHPNIVSVYDTGEEIDQPSGVAVPYIVMELVEGHTLRDILRDGRKILPTKALEFTAGVLDALAYSHKMGIVHRDIKPANVMLTKTGTVKVMDFGIARAVADTSATMTQTAAVIGTAQYLSPEQARGETVDNRSDIYSTGCLLYELLTSRPPFQGDSPVSVAYQHVREAPEPPSKLDSEITAEMDTITLKALAKSPDNRYQNARDMRDDITRLLNGQPIFSTPPADFEANSPVSDLDAPTMYIERTPAPLPPRALVSDTEATQIAPARSFEPANPAQVIGQSQVGQQNVSATPPSEPVKKKKRGALIAIVTLSVLLIAALCFGYYWMTKPASPDLVAVPSLSGQNELMAKATLEDSGLRLGTVTHTNGADDQTVGLVVDQSPTAQQKVERGSSVNVTINDGPKKGTVPDVLSYDKKDAVAALNAAGFKDIKFEDQNPATEEVKYKKDQITQIVPAPGSSQLPDTQIVLTVATGKSPVPNLMGKTEAEATEAAKNAGFEVQISVEETQDAVEGTVYRQSPTDSEKAFTRPGPIKLSIAKKPAQTEPPKPVSPGDGGNGDGNTDPSSTPNP